MNLKEIQGGLAALTVDELRELNRSVIAQLKVKKEMEGLEIKARLQVGTKIKIKPENCRRGEIDWVYTVEKVNRTQAVCTADNKNSFIKYNVPFSIMELIEAEVSK